MNNDYVYKRRLLKLADFLDALPRKRFDLNRWVGEDWKGKPDLSCGTVACSMGWATTIPTFRKLGLILTRNINSHHQYVVALRNEIGSFDSSANAAVEIFGISYKEFMQLFVPGESYENRLPVTATPKQAAAHIRKFVAIKYKNRVNLPQDKCCCLQPKKKIGSVLCQSCLGNL